MNKYNFTMFVVSWGHHPALTTNIFTSIWPIEDRQELW